MINAILKFYGGDPIVAFLLTIGAAFILAPAVAGLWWIWRLHEVKREVEKRHRFQHYMRANSESKINYPPASGRKGFQQPQRIR